MTTDHFFSPARPSLPEPQRERWQPLRLGLVELFRYDSEEFWFHDGHLLLRGNNGTGKSKVLSLTLPLLFDAQLRSSRVEPDGDATKKMAWNLLMGGNYERRIGYSWIEFGRREHDGQARYLTLGVGLSAVAGRAHVDSWYFLIEGDPITGDPRLGQDLWLINAQHQVLTRDRLRDALADRGQVFENNTQGYRRAVDERLFHLGQHRYDALMDTLIQLRQPQLSKKPDETGLSQALSESLPPLPIQLLGDVALALNQLEEDRSQLEETRHLEMAVTQFEQRYRVYAGMLARRQARELRQAQTGFDNASEARNAAQEALEQAQAEEMAAAESFATAKQTKAAAQERVETLQSDPGNKDVNRLAQAERDAAERKREVGTASNKCSEAKVKLQREAELGRQRVEQAKRARTELESSRNRLLDAAGRIGVDAEVITNPLLALANETLAETPLDPRTTTDALRSVVSRRRQEIQLLRQRHAEVDRCQQAFAFAADNAQSARVELDEALLQRKQADQHAEQVGGTLFEAWSEHYATLRQLGVDADPLLRRLTEWVARPEGDNPAQTALANAWQEALQRYATREALLDGRRDTSQRQRAELNAERDRLLTGEDPLPPEPNTRAAEVRRQRLGAPLWQLVDFHPQLEAAGRAGLEAALEASGLLDAWLSPDGTLTDDEGQPWLDVSWFHRTEVTGANLTDVLLPALPEGCPVTTATLTGLLACVAYGRLDDHGAAEAWVSPEGRFRLGTVAGAWRKAEACYIGHTARAHARQRRLQEIAASLSALDLTDTELRQEVDELAADRQQAEREYRQAPSDRPLLEAITQATAAGRDVEQARRRLEQADARRIEAESAVRHAREQVKRDAIDLRLPAEAERLVESEASLEQLDQAQIQLGHAASEWRRAWPAHLEQCQREGEARLALEETERDLASTKEQAEQTLTRFETLRQSIGAKVDALLNALRKAKADLQQAEAELGTANTQRQRVGEQRAVAENEAKRTEETLVERSNTRTEAAERLHRFTVSGLLVSALPDLVLPTQWTIDPTLNLARRIEQALSQIADDEATWTRVQKQIAEDLNELQRALGALGHQAISEPNDFGLTVTIQYQNRAERPGLLAQLLAEDIAQRSELLSAKEREVLENHLQAEIASEIQRLIRTADDRVNAINEELHKRPTTTGVRYRLQWVPLTPEEGAPVGLEEARERLLNTSPDLWSAEERSTVGIMLQQQIATERARADVDSIGSSLIEQLARALDYRHWHRFRIQRQQDGNWRKLSGPASSGERALGLTVPLFAAIASFYGHGASPIAPRLMLLDEAFAGIDDTARAHCMGLVRQFDLDFVITSEREWACYAELPGVAICQLQRREGIDAVFVSRWFWDGRAKQQMHDPDRRFPPL